MENEPQMPGDFFNQKIPDDPCPGCQKRDELIEEQNNLIKMLNKQVVTVPRITAEEVLLRIKIEKLRNEIE